MMYHGYKVMVAPSYPKQQLSNEVIVSDEFRSNTNQWLAELFGRHEALEDGHVISQEVAKTLTMNQRTYDKFRREVMNIKTKPVNNKAFQ